MGLHMEPRKSQVVIGVLRNTGTDPLEMQLYVVVFSNSLKIQ